MFHVLQDLVKQEVWKVTVLTNGIKKLIMSLFVWLLVIPEPATFWSSTVIDICVPIYYFV